MMTEPTSISFILIDPLPYFPVVYAKPFGEVLLVLCKHSLAVSPDGVVDELVEVCERPLTTILREQSAVPP